jgi:chromate reductase
MVTEMEPKMPKVNVAVVVGSNRRESVNQKLARALARLGEGKLTTRFVQIDDLPMFNQDQENPLPASVARFKAEISQADALLIVTPEHNRSIPAVLKNAIDWGARPYGRNSWAGKLAAITGTSPGAIGTAVAQQHLRQVLGNLGAQVMGGEAYVSFKPGLIDENDTLADEGTRKFLQAFIDQLATLAARLASHAPAARNG